MQDERKTRLTSPEAPRKRRFVGNHDRIAVPKDYSVFFLCDGRGTKRMVTETCYFTPP